MAGHRPGLGVNAAPDRPGPRRVRLGGSTTGVAMWSPADPAWYRTAFTEGVEACIVRTQRNRPAAVETRAKVTSRMIQILAEFDGDVDGVISLMLDEFGLLTENSVADVFLIEGGSMP
jgi:hypothetical protein